jgi:hypothetical protein
MSTNLIPIKAFLGKYYPELHYSAIQEKYKDSGLDQFFEQRFYIQNNKIQMIVDPALTGLTVIISGNEIHISKALYDHPNVAVTNSLENKNQTSNPRSLYNADTFSTVAYLVCQNHTMFGIDGQIDEPIYVKYKSDYETFYNSVVVFEIAEGIDVEIVEEIESFSALNAVTNYIVHEDARINLSTFYQNNISALSFVYRNIIAQDNARFNHVLMGKGSSNIIDENKVHAYSKAKTEFLGIVNSNGRKFHSILYVQPAAEDYSVSVDYRDILQSGAEVSFFPVILGQEPTNLATISVSNITLDELPKETAEEEVRKYLSDIVDRAILDRMVGVKRFYDNKAKFLTFP